MSLPYDEQSVLSALSQDMRDLLATALARNEALYSAPFTEQEAEWLVCECAEADTMMIFCCYNEEAPSTESYGLQDWRDDCAKLEAERLCAEESASYSDDFEPSIPGLCEVVFSAGGKVSPTGYACSADREGLVAIIKEISTSSKMAILLDVRSFYLLMHKRLSTEYSSEEAKSIACHVTTQFLDRVMHFYRDKAFALELYLSVSAQICSLKCTVEKYRSNSLLNEELIELAKRNCAVYIAAIKQHLES